MKVLFQSVVPLHWGEAIGKSLVFVLVTALVFGGAYPALVTGFSLLFPEARQGSLLVGKQIEGSRLIGQDYWAGPYFVGRPSETKPACNAASSGASNLAPGNPRFKARVSERIAALQARTGQKTLPPLDLVTASASGLDPHVSEAAALWQVPGVARAAGVSETLLKERIEALAETDLFSRRRYVNVVLLNQWVASQVQRVLPDAGKD